MKKLLNRIFPEKEGIIPFLYIANLIFPLFFLFQESQGKLLIGLLLMVAFVVAYRHAYWSSQHILAFVLVQLSIILVFGFMYDPLYIYMIFIPVYQIVRLPMQWMYVLCGLFTFFGIILIYQVVLSGEYYAILNLGPPLFGGSILPFMIKGSIKYKEMSENLRRTAEELEQKNREMTRLEESKKQMLADISHDLKTPITTIQGYSRALFEGVVSDEAQTERYLKYIYDKSIRVTSLIDELFMFSKLDSPDVPIQKDLKDICEFYRGVIVEHFDLFEEKKMELDIDIPDEKIMVRFDPKLLNRAISNLLQNTNKYNPERTEIYLRLNRTETSIFIEVGDKGVGIRDEIAQILFEPFVRGDKSRKNDGGSGLGLAITKKIIELHDGTIQVDTSPKIGKTNFIIELPIE
ncbi:HAMP domain-containing sensor histidine kinase [Fredinandcohnia sp. QZ13]|uniref:sensor histidine kinase n=1 Tax=Fredinandcohnia sp. QZ13 TaxID=3073144 RepID=UPI0028530D99|nr:HAMP domain-containing sensor histidine kinase [Fredinandcohnia sp. QZ13]MDR4887561.1 HAMP domain-containing sensor histidine kinase [Fredinandcohnia sp. QZ13]